MTKWGLFQESSFGLIVESLLNSPHQQINEGNHIISIVAEQGFDKI